MTCLERPHPESVLRQACLAAGLDAGKATLLHHSSNAVYLLPTERAVARVTFGSQALPRALNTQIITRWLVDAERFPATEPLPGTSPIAVDDVSVVSFWTYYPQPESRSSPTSAHLADLLYQLHHAGEPPAQLAPWIPLVSLHSTLTDPKLSAALSDDERKWLLGRIAEVRDEIDGLHWPLGKGLIHGDAWAENLLWSGAAPEGALCSVTGTGLAMALAKSTSYPPGTLPPDTEKVSSGRATSSTSMATTWPDGTITGHC
jgi:hypothetical protein